MMVLDLLEREKRTFEIRHKKEEGGRERERERERDYRWSVKSLRIEALRSVKCDSNTTNTTILYYKKYMHNIYKKYILIRKI